MNDLACLKEINQPHVFHSQLNISKKSSTRYCVLAENYFIIFKKSSDIMSLYRIPVNKKTSLEFKDSEFTICYSDFSFSFCHQSNAIISQWKDFLNNTVVEDIRESFISFYAEMVQIDKLKNAACPIVISKTGWKLFIYESYEYQRADICTHVINLEYYTVLSKELKEAIFRSVARVLIIKGFLIDFKLTFEDTKAAQEWTDILRCSKENYLKSLNERNVLNEIYKNESNKFCADCGVNDPRWVSINMCITLCENCIGVHRQFGTVISRTQSIIMDEKCWSDSLLVKLLNEIGNETANKFWYLNAPVDISTITMERKYINKEFIDTTYLHLSTDEIVEKLSASVKSSDVVLTMRLWFSNRLLFDRKVVDDLLISARLSQQTLQEKFLSLQDNINRIHSDNDDMTLVFEGVFYLSYDNGEKLPTFFLISLYRDQIIIRADNPDILMKGTVEICTVHLSYINLIQFDNSNSTLNISFYPQCKFSLLKNDRNRDLNYSNINQLSLIDTLPGSSLNKLKRLLLEFLLPNNFEQPTDETSLFLYCDVQINKEELLKCKCHVTNHELFIGCPIETKYDLTTAENVTIVGDGVGVFLVLPHCDLILHLRDNSHTVLSSIRESSKIRFLSLNNCRTLIRIEQMIDFVKFSSHTSKGVFQNDYCDSEKVEMLFVEIFETDNDFRVDSVKYSVDDVACCLKKCVVSLTEPLLSEELFLRLKSALGKEAMDLLFKDTLELMSQNNYKILRLLIELLFIIVKRTKYNEIEKETLFEVTAGSFVSARDDDAKDGVEIMKGLVENFESVFDYLDKEVQALDKFLQSIGNPLQKTVNREFHIDLSLKYLVRHERFVLIEHTKLNDLCNAGVCMTVTVRIDECRSVNDLIVDVFKNLNCQSINLWLFIYVKKSICKRLLYCNECINAAIVDRRTFPANYVGEKIMEILLFLPKEKIALTRTIGTSYRCGIKVEGRQCEIMVSMPNGLAIYDLESNSQTAKHDLKLTDINIYRGHGTNPDKMHILTKEREVISCGFKKPIEFQNFFLHVDSFYFKQITVSPV